MNNYHDITLLIVDDEEDIRYVIKNMLKSKIATILEAENGIDALQLMQKQKVDLAIIDINMPKLNGIGLLREITKRYPEIISMILTGYGSKEDAIEAIKHNAFDFLEKPISEEILKHRVQKAVELHKRNFLLKAAIEEFVINHCEIENYKKFHKLSVEEQNKILEAGLGLLKLKGVNRIIGDKE